MAFRYPRSAPAGVRFGLFAVLAVAPQTGRGQPAAETPPADGPGRPFLSRHCVECHGPTAQKGDFRVDTLPADPADPKARDAWAAVRDRVAAGTMPPAKRPRPPATRRPP